MWIIVVNKSHRDVRYLGPFKTHKTARDTELVVGGQLWVKNTEIVKLTEAYVGERGEFVTVANL